MSNTTHYQPLARRYRPTRFKGEGGLIGQPHVVQTLTNAVKTRELANAYLLTGPRGTGKTTAARILAASLNCTAETDSVEPCGTCETCSRILGGKESNDVIEIDAATNRGAEDARALRQQAMYAPSSSSAWRVYVLDEAHMLTKEAWNALLKVLEEPPPRVLFVFCTTEPQKIQQAAPPILSRCQRLDMRRLVLGDIFQHMNWICKQEGIEADEEALGLVARRADGGMRDALSMLDQLRAFQGGGAITVEAVRQAFGMQSERLYLAIIAMIADRERGRVFKLIRHLEETGADFIRFLEDWQDTLSCFAQVNEGGGADDWSEEAQKEFRRLAGFRDGDGGQTRSESPVLSTPQIVELMALAQEDSLAVRQASRPSTLILTSLQRSITLVEQGQ